MTLPPVSQIYNIFSEISKLIIKMFYQHLSLKSKVFTNTNERQ